MALRPSSLHATEGTFGEGVEIVRGAPSCSVRNMEAALGICDLFG